MAEGMILVRDMENGEKTQDYNKRLRQAWESTPVAEAKLSVVDGVPVVTLIGALEAATEEDVEEERAQKVGDPVLAATPLACAICLVDVAKADKTEERLESLCANAGDALVDVQIVTGDTFTWIEHPVTRDRLYVPDKITFALVVWEIEFTDEEEDTEDTGAAEDTENAEDVEEDDVEEVAADHE